MGNTTAGDSNTVIGCGANIPAINNAPLTNSCNILIGNNASVPSTFNNLSSGTTIVGKGMLSLGSASAPILTVNSCSAGAGPTSCGVPATADTFLHICINGKEYRVPLFLP
jgi:hypothetical protein